jgi:hypothetical protein
MPPKKSVEVKKKSASRSSKIVWSEVVDGFNVKEKVMKPMKVTKVCKYNAANGGSRFRLAGEDAKSGQPMSKFASAQDALDIAMLAGLKVQTCTLKPRVVKVKKVVQSEKSKAKVTTKPKAEKSKAKVTTKPKAEKAKAKVTTKPKAEKAKVTTKPKAEKSKAKVTTKPKVEKAKVEKTEKPKIKKAANVKPKTTKK